LPQVKAWLPGVKCEHCRRVLPLQAQLACVEHGEPIATVLVPVDVVVVFLVVVDVAVVVGFLVVVVVSFLDVVVDVVVAVGSAFPLQGILVVDVGEKVVVIVAAVAPCMTVVLYVLVVCIPSKLVLVFPMIRVEKE
jgi:hypothetical protein